MKIHFEKDLPVLLFALLMSASTLGSLPQVESAWMGVKAVYDKQDFGLRILREAMLVALTSQNGADKPAGLVVRVSEGGRLVWKTPESSLSACCGIHGIDRRQDKGIK